MFKELLHTLFYTEIFIQLSIVHYVLRYTSQPHMIWGILRKPLIMQTQKHLVEDFWNCFSRQCQKKLWFPAFHVKTGSTYALKLHSKGNYACMCGNRRNFPLHIYSLHWHMLAEQPWGLMLTVFNGVPGNTQSQIPRVVVLNTRFIWQFPRAKHRPLQTIILLVKGPYPSVFGFVFKVTFNKDPSLIKNQSLRLFWPKIKPFSY